MGKQSFERPKKILAFFVTVLFVVTLASASVNAADSVKTNKNCCEYVHGYFDGFKQGYHEGFTDGEGCKDAHRLPIHLHFPPCSSGYFGGHFNGYVPGYFNGYADGKIFCLHPSP
jgi:hypothetical protein